LPIARSSTTCRRSSNRASVLARRRSLRGIKQLCRFQSHGQLVICRVNSRPIRGRGLLGADECVGGLGRVPSSVRLRQRQVQFPSPRRRTTRYRNRRADPRVNFTIRAIASLPQIEPASPGALGAVRSVLAATEVHFLKMPRRRSWAWNHPSNRPDLDSDRCDCDLAVQPQLGLRPGRRARADNRSFSGPGRARDEPLLSNAVASRG
jgi:hypothetical protein